MEYLSNAVNVQITEDMERPHTLTFEYPMIDDKAEKITENRIVSVEGQAYRLYDVSRIYSGSRILRAKAERIFYRDAQDYHIPTIGNDTDPSKSTIGCDPYVVIREAVKGTKFELIPDNELAEMGMTRIGADGLKIDFFPTDKINIYDAITNVMETAGKGELYVDNFRIAVVERIGEDNGVRLSLTKNLQSLTVQYSSDQFATRLYAYGKDDMTISSVNDGKPYVQNDEAVKKYGVICASRDYPDYTDPEKIKAHAEWDLMGEGNYNRLDEPRLTLTCDMLALDKLEEYGSMEKIHLGDVVYVYDDNTRYTKRVMSMTYYPYENKQPTVTIGLPSTRNAFFQAWQKSKIFKSVLWNTARGKKVKTNNFHGTVNSTQNPVKSENKKLTLDGDLLEIKDSKRVRIRIGNYGGEFVFIIYDKESNEAVYLNEFGEAVFAGTIQTMKDCLIQGELRVGMSGNNTKGLSFYGDACVPDKDGNYSTPYARIVPWVDAYDDKITGIKVTGGKLCVDGGLVADKSDITNLQEQIDEIQRQIQYLQDKLT